MKTFSEITLDYEKTLTVATRLRFWAHWLIGGVVFFVAMLIGNPSGVFAAITESPSLIPIGFMSFGLIAGIISNIIVMRLIPAPYAWLATRLGLTSPSV
ncbi:MAG: hypothetical protein Q7K57_25065 [Burkholderiaceae bacterium]|nr:hypothetical protein [Burkholderiaceae bacterium]